MDEFKQQINSIIDQKLSSMTNMSTGNHAHNGYDVNQLDPSVALSGWPVIQVTDATVAPTDIPIQGTFRYYVDTTPHYILWVWITYLSATTILTGAWKSINLVTGNSPLTTKGDIYTFSTVNTRLPVGTNGQYLVADSTQTTGLKYYTIANASGTTTKDAADASATQNIAHGLPTIPTNVSILATTIYSSTGVQWLKAETTYNGTTQSSNSVYISGNVATTADNTFTLNVNTATGTQRGVVTFDATNIIITWTKTGTASGTYQLLWKANT